ncbi:cupin domain-containing protein [Sphingosinicella humi]|uniref:Cupin n=1 Tax=Allosphingosinicella humi TaxID=2068657 RepID=A0A2U2J081_9SPHN|nr:cupin domain-containing protein [Sphingosinicella humi]PWG01744.1 cupin [Sphingosinicella humi]
MALKHANPGEVVDLRPLGSGLKDAKTSALVKSDRFEAVRLIVPAGTTIPPHKVEGFLTLHCLEGRVVLGIGKDIELQAGDWIYLERGAAHSVRGLEDSSLLLTILFDGRQHR